MKLNALRWATRPPRLTAILARRFEFAPPMNGTSPPAVIIAGDERGTLPDRRVLLEFTSLEQSMCFGMALTAESKRRLDERDALDGARR